MKVTSLTTLELLARITTLCVDKTGTLTLNQLALKMVVDNDGNTIDTDKISPEEHESVLRTLILSNDILLNNAAEIASNSARIFQYYLVKFFLLLNNVLKKLKR